ncbi:MAG: ABC transporter ATP-binding protein [Comamonas sp.]
MSLLEVTNLTINLQTHRGRAQAVREVSFSLERGAALALMGLLPQHAQVDGSILLDGMELLEQSEKQLCALRGNRMAMVFQEPMSALNPVHSIGRQVAEPLRLHLRLSRAQARSRAIELLERVGIAHAAQRFDDYPHQFSGGQRQRITIAMALACEPELLIADEPTTALDVTIQQQILDLISDLVDERQMALILISHDLGVVSQNVDHLLVMYGGSVVESGATEAIFHHMGHPYTRGLLGARPQMTGPRHRLPTIAGSVPELADMPAGCPFAGRCPHTVAACARQRPPAIRVDAAADHWARCLLPDVVHAPFPAAALP